MWHQESASLPPAGCLALSSCIVLTHLIASERPLSSFRHLISPCDMNSHVTHNLRHLSLCNPYHPREGLQWRPIKVAFHHHLHHVGWLSHCPLTYGLFPVLFNHQNTSSFAPWHHRSNLSSSSARHPSFLDQPYFLVHCCPAETSVPPGNARFWRIRCMDQSSDPFWTRACCHHHQVWLQTRWPCPDQKYCYREVSQSQNACEISRSAHRHIAEQGWCIHRLRTWWLSLWLSNCSILSHPIFHLPAHRHSSTWWTYKYLHSLTVWARELDRCWPQWW